jgi:hypothetical protein
VKGEVNVINGAELSPEKETNYDQDPTTTDGQGDYAMGDPLEPLDKGEGKASTADEMSSGDISPPTPAPTKAGKVTTPKVKHVAKSPKTPKTPTGEAANTSPGDAIKTPVAMSPNGKKRGRKTKAQKEAEAAAASTVEGEEVEETSSKKPRKMSAKKAKTDTTAENREGNKVDTNKAEGGQTDTPVKSRKSSVKKANNEENSPAIERSTASNAVKESDKAGPKLGATRAKNAATILPTEPDTSRKDPGQGKMDQDTVTMVSKAAVLANEVLEGKKIATKTARYVQLLRFVVELTF